MTTATATPDVRKLDQPRGLRKQLQAMRKQVHAVRKHRAVPAMTLAGVCAVAAFSEAGADDGQVLCPYRLATGGWCPACGCTRALGAVIRGDLAGSVAYNPWSMLLLAQATVITSWIFAAPEAAKAWWKKHNGQVLAINLAVAAIIWAVRLIWGVVPLPFT